jgi:hypothetical protein
MITISERDVFNTKPGRADDIAVSDYLRVLSPCPRDVYPEGAIYLLSGQVITLMESRAQSVSVTDPPGDALVSPAWLGRVKRRLRELMQLAAGWDSYGAPRVDPRIEPIAEDLIEWFAVDDMPAPDIFATTEGGIQIEWHIRGVNVEIDISPDESTVYFHDIQSGDAPWVRRLSPTDLRGVRRRLLVHV